MPNRLNRHSVGTTGTIAFALATSLLLSACQLGGSPDSPTSDDIDNAAKDQQAQVQSNTEGSQGGAVVGASDEKSSDEGATDESTPNASKKTGFDDLWMLDAVTTSDGTTIYDDQDVLYYGTTYETVLAVEFYDTDGEKIFACSLPGIDIIGNWEETGETHADLSIPISDTETMSGSYDMSDDYQTAELKFDQVMDDGSSVIYKFHRDDDTTITLDSMYEAMVENNDKFYDELPIDVASDITFADDDKVQMRLLGTTHADGMVGYVLEVTNKTDTPYIINDFIADEGTLFTVNGTTQLKPLIGRVLPPTTVDEETGETLVAPMRCAILFSEEEVGEGGLMSAAGNIVVTDYHWNEAGRYPFAMGQ